MNWLNRHRSATYWFFGLSICFAISYPNIRANMSAVAELQRTTQENSAKEWQLLASQQSLQSRSEIAEQRYQAGCIMVVATNSPDQLTALEEGQPIIDAARNRPLSPGAVVCDGFGNTGVIVSNEAGEPVVGKMAFTGNATLIEAAKNRVNKKYSLPNI